MRALFWLGFLAVVGMAVGVYVAASQASRPGTPLAELTGGAFLSQSAKAAVAADEAVELPDEPVALQEPLPAAPIPVSVPSASWKVIVDPYQDMPMPTCEDHLPRLMPYAKSTPR